MGSIYKRGAVFWIQYYRNGRPYCLENMTVPKVQDAGKKPGRGFVSDKS